jgi:hypothetical protein
MAMNNLLVWWLSKAFLVGLVLLFIGERPFGHLETGRWIMTVPGLLAIFAATGLRAWAFLKATGERRRIERLTLLCYGGALLALLGYFLTTKTGMDWIGLADAEEKTIERFRVPMTVLWTILMTASVLPLVMIELSLGGLRRVERGQSPEEAVEVIRVRELATSGLTVALCAAFLMVTCNIAGERNKRVDMSYFKTSSPGNATVEMVRSMSKPLQVLLFFPEVNEVKSEVGNYFESLAAATGNVQLSYYDRMAAPTVAKDNKVTTDGTILLKRGDKSENITVNTEIERARRSQLRTFDEKVQKALMQVIRPKRVAYFTVGHGELNDPDSGGYDVADLPPLKSTLLKTLMSRLNYEVKDLGLAQGLASQVPDDASIVFVLGPRKPLLPEELAALDAYLAKGGSLLLSLDPTSEASLGTLEGRLGLRFNPTSIADDKEFLVRRRNDSDHQLILTNQFLSHASVTTLSRAGARAGIMLLNSGSLADAEFTSKGKTPPRRTYVIRSLESSFADLNKNFRFDEGQEKRERYNLAAAIEDPSARQPGKQDPAADADKDKDKKAADKNGADKKANDKPKKADKDDVQIGSGEGMRALVFADTEIFSDLLLSQIPLMQALIMDAIKWLGGEEKFSGETTSEEDVKIEHTRSEDVVWFYLTIVGAPVLVLGVGLFYVWWRRRHTARRTS